MDGHASALVQRLIGMAAFSVVWCLAPSLVAQTGVKAAVAPATPVLRVAYMAPSKNGDKKKSGEEDNSSDDSNDDGEAVTRPTEPPRVPDPRELDAEVVNGRVRFAFNGQPWPDVLQWLANASKLSLDWQELPPGYLNLTTQRAYSLAEARDLLNRHLQARGYVLLLSGEVLSVA
ncbi:MAG: hypothetical protein AAGG46_08820, partial [Planctomycetota bacterium]